MSGLIGSVPMVRPITPTIMIEIVLLIMLLVINMPTLYILRLMQPRPLLARHDAVRLGSRFHILHVLLAALQAPSLSRRQTAGINALLDTRLLIGFTLINAWGVCLRQSSDGDKDAKSSNGFDGFHDFLLMMFVSLSTIKR